jgi:two-component system, OmpR family, sensor kinase
MLVRMDKEKTQATLRATHELKAPFAAIKSYVYTLRDGYCGELPDKAKAVVGRIGDRCDHLTRKITDIIHLSNLQTLLVSDMDLKPVDLTALLKEEAEEGALLGKPRGITVHPPDETEPVYVHGSKVHLRTLVSNLIQNAVFYSRKGEGAVSLSVHHQPNRVSVIVSDNGIGIPSENLDKIFDEHFRSKNAVAHHADGTGLGLSLVKEIARLHGATVSVESTVGKGAAFTVSFDPLGTEPERENHGAHTHH